MKSNLIFKSTWTHRGLLCKIISILESSIFLKWRLFKLSNISISLQSRIEKSASCRGFYIFKNFTVFYDERNKIRVIRVYLIRTAYFVLIHPCVKEGFNERQYQFPSFSINSARLRHSYRNFSYELGELFYVQLVNRLMPPFEREREPPCIIKSILTARHMSAGFDRIKRVPDSHQQCSLCSQICPSPGRIWNGKYLTINTAPCINISMLLRHVFQFASCYFPAFVSE